jgi:hypothetical protein
MSFVVTIQSPTNTQSNIEGDPMIPRFDLYDFIANLIPGLVFLWCVQVLVRLMGWHLPLDFSGGLAETSILVALSYIVGLLLQGVSQGLVEKHLLIRVWKGFPSERWLLPDDEHFSTDYKKRLLSLIAMRFKVTTEPDLPPNCPPNREQALRLKKNRELFSLCYHDVGNSNPRPLILNAHYGLFRCLLTMFALLALLSLIGLVFALLTRKSQVMALGVWTCLFLISTVITYARCKKRAEDFAQSVFDLFMVNATSKITN